jgi:predicted RNase H-like HicB family nuclease
MKSFYTGAKKTRFSSLKFPELPGCAAHGNSPDKALKNCNEAIRLWIETAKEFGRTIPEPKGRRLQCA